jgi:hypothetical protein
MAGDVEVRHDSTLADARGFEGRIRARRGRRAVLAVLAIVIALAATSALGVHTSTKTTSAGGWTMRLDYPRVARAGLDTMWRVQVEHPGGFGGKEIELAVTADYFDIFETQGFHPEPSKSTRDGEFLRLSFDPPKADTFAVDFDAYIQPSSQLGRSAEVRLMDGERTRLSVRYRTWLVP